MKITTLVAFLILPFTIQAQNLSTTLDSLESKWANVYYSSANNKNEAYAKLISACDKLTKQYPNKAEIYFLKAVIKATQAEHLGALDALATIKESRDLLLKAIKINATTNSGSAYVTLGTLYYLAPSWPISFGDTHKAEQYLKKALEINPNGMDSNYYYGDFLLHQDKNESAAIYLKKATEAKIRKEQALADSHLQADAFKALQSIKNTKSDTASNIVAAITGPSKN